MIHYKRVCQRYRRLLVPQIDGLPARQLPPTILSANNKSGATKVKLKPIPLPDESPTANGEKEVVVDLGPGDNEIEDVVDAMGNSTIDTRRTELRSPRTLETTLFDRLERIYGPGIKRLLAVQYR